MAWKQGPLPPDSYNWGGVVTADITDSGCFYFADFRGNHVAINPYTPQEKVVKAEEVLWYDNSLELPPTGQKGQTRPMWDINLTIKG